VSEACGGCGLVILKCSCGRILNMLLSHRRAVENCKKLLKGNLVWNLTSPCSFQMRCGMHWANSVACEETKEVVMYKFSSYGSKDSVLISVLPELY